MNKQDDKDEAIAPGVRHNKQEGIDTTPQKVLEREQQGAEEQEEEEQEQGTAKGKERKVQTIRR